LLIFLLICIRGSFLIRHCCLIVQCRFTCVEPKWPEPTWLQMVIVTMAMVNSPGPSCSLRSLGIRMSGVP
jgi:hypothetical protein